MQQNTLSIGLTVRTTRELRSLHDDRPVLPSGLEGTITAINGDLVRVDFDPEQLPDGCPSDVVIPVQSLDLVAHPVDMAANWDICANIQRGARFETTYPFAAYLAVHYLPIAPLFALESERTR